MYASCLALLLEVSLQGMRCGHPGSFEQPLLYMVRTVLLLQLIIGTWILWALYILAFCWPHSWGTHGSMVRCQYAVRLDQTRSLLQTEPCRAAGALMDVQ